MKRLFIALALLIALVAIPVTVFAHSLTLSTTQFYACENATTGEIDANSITQNDALDCSTNQGAFTTTVQWSVTGPAGKDGTNGTNGTNGQDGATGPQGPKGDTGPAGPQGPQGANGQSGLPFSHAACTETGLSGVQQQENLLFCISGIEPDGGLIYKTALSAASFHILVGTPIAQTASVDWGGSPITYVEFTSGFHMEYHADNKVRVFNTLNQQVF